MWLAGLCVLALAVGGAWWLFRDPTYTAEPVDRPRPQANAADAAEALHALADAVVSRDVEAAQALGADDADRDLLAAVVDNARRLDVAGFTLRYVDRVGATQADGSRVATADAGWRFAGVDRRTARTEVAVRLRDLGDRVAVTGFGGSGRAPVWLSGPVRVVRRPGVLVVASDRAAGPAPASLARMAGHAREVVRRVLPRWREPVVIEVPASAADLDAALAAEPGEYAAVAAVTASVDGTAAPDAAVHVFLNPQVFSGLDRRGARIVTIHEVAHLATTKAAARAPLWLVEGFADYVALRDVRLPLSTTAAQVRRQVRADGVPRRLPGPAEFDIGASHLGAAYEAAWLACRLIADRWGERALVGLLDDVRDGVDLDLALREHTGIGVAGLTRAWRARLAALAG